jgi:membrane dipeptidase
MGVFFCIMKLMVFIKEALIMDNGRAEMLHREAVVVDGHCDTIHLFRGIRGPYVFEHKNVVGHVDLPRLREGGVDIQFFALYIEPEYKPYSALVRTLTLMEHFWREMGKHTDSVKVIQSVNDLNHSIDNRKLGVVMALEGAEGLESTEILHMLHRLGLRSVGLTWNQRNQLADGVGVGESAGGLTSFGKEMVREMNSLGILVDAAHVATRGFNDILDVSTSPIVVTHANAYGVCPHRRNLSDEQLKALRDAGGVVGLTFYPPFVHESGEAGLEELLDHFCYIAQRFGSDILGLGADFDGISRSVTGLEDVSKLPMLTKGLIQRGFSESEVKKILGENFLRVLRSNLGVDDGKHDCGR